MLDFTFYDVLCFNVGRAYYFATSGANCDNFQFRILRSYRAV